LGGVRELAEKHASTSDTMIKAIMVAGLISIAAVIGIYFFLTVNGLEVLKYDSITDLLFGTQWRPEAFPPKLGLFPMIVATIYVTVLSVLFAFPISLLCATYLAEFAPAFLRKTLRPAIDMLAGIPSVVYGLFGIMVLVPFARQYLGAPEGYSVLTAAMVVAVMILPYMTSVMMEAFRAVPREYIEAARGMGASWYHVVKDVILPMAKPGITAGITLSMCRAAEEAAPIILTAVMIGLLSPNPFVHVLQPTDALAFRIYLLAKEYIMTPAGMQSAFAAAAVLVLITLGLNGLAIYLRETAEKKVGRV